MLIIGILAAIALPQYKLAVGKTRYATLKNTTNALRDATERFYLVHNTLPTKFDDLDISFSINNEIPSSGYFTLKFKDMTCDVYNTSFLIYCFKDIGGQIMYYWTDRTNTVCYSGSADTTDINNRICQQETGKTAADCSLAGNTCVYFYN